MNAARTKSLGLRVRAIQTARFGHSPRIRMVWAGFRPMGKPDGLVGDWHRWCCISLRLVDCLLVQITTRRHFRGRRNANTVDAGDRDYEFYNIVVKSVRHGMTYNFMYSHNVNN